jgi:predicted nucleic-acid-binding protein
MIVVDTNLLVHHWVQGDRTEAAEALVTAFPSVAVSPEAFAA